MRIPFLMPKSVYSWIYPAVDVDNENAIERMSMSVENTRPLTSSSTHRWVMIVERTQLAPLAL